MAQALFATGWPQSSEEFGKENGTYVMHSDTERGHPDRAARSSSGVRNPSFATSPLTPARPAAPQARRRRRHLICW